MEDPDIEEEVSRSNFAFLSNHYLNIKGSMGLFPSNLQSSHISHNSLSHQFLNTKSSSSSVFDRLIQDSNRRSNAIKKIKDYKSMLESEYENSLLSTTRLSRHSEAELLTRLMIDTQRRFKNHSSIETFKKEQEPVKKFEKWPMEKTEEIVKRLAFDCRDKISKREQIRRNIQEEEIKVLQNIRNQKHPKRRLNGEVMQRIYKSNSPVRDRCEGIRGKSLRNERVSRKVMEMVERLHKPSPLKGIGGWETERPKELNKDRKKVLNFIRKKIVDDEIDDYFSKLKATLIKGRKNPTN